jgi:hypothetical protein
MRNDCTLVIICWQDSAQPPPSWQYLSALPRTRLVECATVGWLLKADDDMKVVCQSVGVLDNPKKRASERYHDDPRSLPCRGWH